MVTTARTKSKQTWRGFNFPARDSIYRYHAPYNAGYDLEFSKTQREALLHADVLAFNREYEPLLRVLDDIVSTK